MRLDNILYTGILIVKNLSTYSHQIEFFLKEIANFAKVFKLNFLEYSSPEIILKSGIMDFLNFDLKYVYVQSLGRI